MSVQSQIARQESALRAMRKSGSSAKQQKHMQRSIDMMKRVQREKRKQAKQSRSRTPSRGRSRPSRSRSRTPSRPSARPSAPVPRPVQGPVQVPTAPTQRQTSLGLLHQAMLKQKAPSRMIDQQKQARERSTLKRPEPKKTTSKRTGWSAGPMARAQQQQQKQKQSDWSAGPMQASTLLRKRQEVQQKQRHQPGWSLGPMQKAQQQQEKQRQSDWSAGPMQASTLLRQQQEQEIQQRLIPKRGQGFIPSMDVAKDLGRWNVPMQRTQQIPQDRETGWVGPMRRVQMPQRPQRGKKIVGFDAHAMRQEGQRPPIPDMISNLGPPSALTPTPPTGFVPAPDNTIFDFRDTSNVPSSTYQAISKAPFSPISDETVAHDFTGPIREGVKRAPAPQTTQSQISGLKTLRKYAVDNNNTELVGVLDNRIADLSRKTIVIVGPQALATPETQLSIGLKEEKKMVDDFNEGYKQGKWQTVREYATELFDKDRMMKSGGPLGGFAKNIVRGDDLEITKMTEALVKSINRLDKTKSTVTKYNKQDGIQGMYYGTEDRIQDEIDSLQSTISSLDVDYPALDEYGEIITYTYDEGDGTTVDGTSSEVAGWASRKIAECRESVDELQDYLSGGKDNLSIFQQGQAAAREWHPKTEVYGYDPMTHHIDDSGFVVPGITRDEDGVAITGSFGMEYYPKHLYPGSENYGTYKKAFYENRVGLTTATSFTGVDPLGLKSLTAIIMGDKDKADDIKFEAMHSATNVLKEYNPATDTWTDLSWQETVPRAAQFAWNMPTTQIGIAMAGGSIAGSAGTAAMSSMKIGAKALTASSKLGQIGMLAGGTALAVPSARNIHYSWEKGDTPAVVSQVGMLGATALAGYAGYRHGTHMKFSSPSGKYTKWEFTKGFFKQPKRQYVAKTTGGKIKEFGSNLFGKDSWAKKPGLSPAQFGAERGYQRFLLGQKGRMGKNLPPIKQSKWLSLEESRSSGLRYGRKKGISRTPVKSAKQADVLLDLRRSSAQLKDAGWGSEAFGTRYGYDDILPSDINALAAKLSRAKKPGTFMKNYMTKFVTAKRRKGEVLGSVLSKEGKLQVGDLDFHTVAREYAKIRYAARKAGLKVPKSLKDNLTNLGVDIQQLERVGSVRTRFGQQKLPSVQRGGVKYQSPSEQWSTLIDIASETPSMRAGLKGGKVVAKDIQPAIQQSQRLWAQAGRPKHLQAPYQKMITSLKYLEKHPHVLSPAETAYLYPKSTLGDKWFQLKTKAIEKTMPTRYFEKDLSQTMGWLRQKMPVGVRSSGIPSVSGQFGSMGLGSSMVSMGVSSVPFSSTPVSQTSRSYYSRSHGSSRPSSSIASSVPVSSAVVSPTHSSSSSGTSSSISSSVTSSSPVSSSSSPSSSSSSSSSTAAYHGRGFGYGFGLLPVPRGQSQMMGGGGGFGWGDSGYKEREHKVPNIWKSSGASQWRRSSPQQARQQPRQARQQPRQQKDKGMFFSLSG